MKGKSESEDNMQQRALCWTQTSAAAEHPVYTGHMFYIMSVPLLLLVIKFVNIIL